MMTALYLQGRQADALRAFQRLRGNLIDELGIEPSRELQDLEAKLLRQDDLRPAAPPPAASRPPLPTGVVTFLLTDIVGSTMLWEDRPNEMAEAVAHHEVLFRTCVEAQPRSAAQGTR